MSSGLKGGSQWGGSQLASPAKHSHPLLPNSRPQQTLWFVFSCFIYFGNYYSDNQIYFNRWNNLIKSNQNLIAGKTSKEFVCTPISFMECWGVIGCIIDFLDIHSSAIDHLLIYLTFNVPPFYWTTYASEHSPLGDWFFHMPKNSPPQNYSVFTHPQKSSMPLKSVFGCMATQIVVGKYANIIHQ